MGVSECVVQWYAGWGAAVLVSSSLSPEHSHWEVGVAPSVRPHPLGVPGYPESSVHPHSSYCPPAERGEEGGGRGEGKGERGRGGGRERGGELRGRERE